MSVVNGPLDVSVLPQLVGLKLVEQTGCFDWEADDFVILPEEEYFNIFTDDGKGYAVSSKVLLDGESITWRCETANHTWVWCYNVSAWCEVGEDL